ncbi:MAG: GGDEF domain-containing protein [Sulfurimonas sp.]|nr:GGDEF domain-containing protein [Sulfurimonas sp.]
MFFGNNNQIEEELKEELVQQSEQIETLHIALKKMNIDFDKKLDGKTQVINDLTRKLNSKIQENEEMQKELEHKSRALKESLDNLERVSNSDTLTGAYNKRYFYDVAESIISLAKREKEPLTLAIIEINQLDEINHIYGYSVGDEILQTFVHKIVMRESDLFVRFTDKEFVILLPNTDLDHALIILEKIRKNIESCVFLKNIEVTVSIGVSEFLVSEENINDALKKVKMALKEASKNSINNIFN